MIPKENVKKDEPKKDIANDVQEFKKRMLSWGNPVEFVNNMYGCHPGDDNTNYFEEVFKT